jgi:hypothetical protein
MMPFITDMLEKACPQIKPLVRGKAESGKRKTEIKAQSAKGKTELINRRDRKKSQRTRVGEKPGSAGVSPAWV